MPSAMHIARSGLEALDAHLRTISNNLANVKTTAFKRDRTTFETLLYQTTRPGGAPVGADQRFGMGLTTGAGVRIAGTERDQKSGSIDVTTNALDWAIDGEGFFEVLMPDGSSAYTRAGALTRDAEGRVVTPQGYQINPPIEIPEHATEISVSPTGVVSVVMEGDTNPTEIGQMTLTTFINPAGLEPISGTFYRESAASGPPEQQNPGENGAGALRQGMLETSNVSPVQELVDMIETQRAYEINSKVISTADEMMRYVNQTI